MLFMSEEGTEQGGLIWGAYQHSDGSVESHGHLSFDQYEENQIFALDAGREGNEKFSRITIADQGNYPVGEKREAVRRIMNLPIPYAGKYVKAEGKLFERGGSHAIAIEKITVVLKPNK